MKAPTDLDMAVLPSKCPDTGKLIFPLTEDIGEWTTLEVELAVEMGYELVWVYQVIHWEQRTTEIFERYVNLFLKGKQEASGYPKDVKTEEQKQKYIQDYYDHEGIWLDSNKIEKNPGKRALCKLCLNNCWGRYAMADNKPTHVFLKRGYFRSVVGN